MDAGCRLYDMALQLPCTQHEEARRHACKRAHQCKPLRRSVQTHAIRPPQHNSRWAQWLGDSVSSTADSTAVRAARPLVLSRTLFHGSKLSSECDALARLWVAYWALQSARTSFSADRGFGLVTAVKVKAGRVVARGLLEKDYDEPHFRVLGGGTMYGPAAFVNAACKETCANAIFRVERGVWCVEAKRGLRVGEEVLVHYPARGVCMCGATEWD